MGPTFLRTVPTSLRVMPGQEFPGRRKFNCSFGHLGPHTYTTIMLLFPQFCCHLTALKEVGCDKTSPGFHLLKLRKSMGPSHLLCCSLQASMCLLSQGGLSSVKMILFVKLTSLCLMWRSSSNGTCSCSCPSHIQTLRWKVLSLCHLTHGLDQNSSLSSPCF